MHIGIGLGLAISSKSANSPIEIANDFLIAIFGAPLISLVSCGLSRRRSRV
jgi:hypothetical protein